MVSNQLFYIGSAYFIGLRLPQYIAIKNGKTEAFWEMIPR